MQTRELTMIIAAKTQSYPDLAEWSVEELLARMSHPWDNPGINTRDIWKVEIPFHNQAEQIAAIVGGRRVPDELDATTEHVWLVVMGQFAQMLGLIQGLEGVPIDQKQNPQCPPQTKLIELLVGVLGGIEYLQDLNLEAHPIASDATVAQAWAQAIFAHYSGVSRTMEAADEQTLAAVIEVLRQVSQPFIQAAVLETIRKQGGLTADVDLTGREVSPTSTDYPDARLAGWQTMCITATRRPSCRWCVNPGSA
jgi:hypothetical protein